MNLLEELKSHEETEQIYSVLLDIGNGIDGILSIYPIEVNEDEYDELVKANKIFKLNKDIVLDFGYSATGVRFSGLTDQYSSIDDLVAKMIMTSVDQVNKGQDNSGFMRSLDNTTLIVPPNFILPPNLAKMYNRPHMISRISYDMAINGVGRLSQMLKAVTFNVKHPND